jgi:hypothetical protein
MFALCFTKSVVELLSAQILPCPKSRGCGLSFAFTLYSRFSLERKSYTRRFLKAEMRGGGLF